MDWWCYAKAEGHHKRKRVRYEANDRSNALLRPYILNHLFKHHKTLSKSVELLVGLSTQQYLRSVTAEKKERN